MKTLKKISILTTLLVFCLSTFAESKDKKKVKTIEFTVSGVCNMCENRIENAAQIKGVKLTDWNKETQKLKVIFNPEKAEEMAIHKAVAKAGHDTDKVKATDEAYDKLHECCKYRDGLEIH